MPIKIYTPEEFDKKMGIEVAPVEKTPEPSFPKYEEQVKKKNETLTTGQRIWEQTLISVPKIISNFGESAVDVVNIAGGALKDNIADIRNKDLQNYTARVTSAASTLTKTAGSVLDWADAFGSAAGSTYNPYNIAKTKIEGGSLSQQFTKKMNERSARADSFGDVVNSYGATMADIAKNARTRESSIVKNIVTDNAFESAFKKNFTEKLREAADQNELLNQELYGESGMLEKLTDGVFQLVGFIGAAGAVRGATRKTVDIVAKDAEKEIKNSIISNVTNLSNVALEATMEGNEVRRELIAKGYTPEEATQKSLDVVAQNMFFIGLSNKADGIFDVNTYRGMKRLGGYALAAAGEGSQEVFQTFASNYATGRPLTEGSGEAFILGAVLGGGARVAFDVQDLISLRKSGNLPEADAKIDTIETLDAEQKNILKKMLRNEASNDEIMSVIQKEADDVVKNEGQYVQVGSEDQQYIIDDVRESLAKGVDVVTIQKQLENLNLDTDVIADTLAKASVPKIDSTLLDDIKSEIGAKQPKIAQGDEVMSESSPLVAEVKTLLKNGNSDAEIKSFLMDDMELTNEESSSILRLAKITPVDKIQTKQKEKLSEYEKQLEEKKIAIDAEKEDVEIRKEVIKSKAEKIETAAKINYGAVKRIQDTGSQDLATGYGSKTAQKLEEIADVLGLESISDAIAEVESITEARRSLKDNQNLKRLKEEKKQIEEKIKAQKNLVAKERKMLEERLRDIGVDELQKEIDQLQTEADIQEYFNQPLYQKTAAVEVYWKNNNPEKGVKIYGSIIGNVAKLDSLEISKDLQGKGLGTKYFNLFKEWAIENGAESIKIDAFKNSIGFWENMGFSLEEDFPVIGGVKQSFKNGVLYLNITKTKKFKSWFGDWENNPKDASKIVDEKGNPLVVYHGTNSNDFTEFDKKRIGNRDSGWFGKGFYFALSKGEAQYYGKNVIPVYLNIRNPFDFSKFYKGIENHKGFNYTDTYYLSKISDEVKDLETFIKGYIYTKGNEDTDYQKIPSEITLEKYKELVNLENLTPKPVYFEQSNGTKTVSYKYTDINGNEKWFDSNKTEPIPTELLKYVIFDNKYGTDFGTSGLYGVERKIAEYKNFTDKLKDLGYDGTMQSPYGDEYVAFEPNQIKSATGKNNEFSKESNDIMFQKENIFVGAGFITTEEALTRVSKLPIFKAMSENGRVAVKNSLNAKDALGMYSPIKGVIEFVKNPHETTLPHETFHAALDLAFSNDEKNKILELAREVIGKNATDLQAEEYLAQRFAEWWVAGQKPKTISEKIHEMFKKIKEFFLGAYDSEKEITKLFKDIAGESIVSRVDFSAVGGMDAVYRLYYQDQEGFTNELFNNKELWAKTNQKRATVEGAVNKLKKPAMKEFVKAKLASEFAGREVINMQDLKQSIMDELLDVYTIESSSYSNYGLGNIGVDTDEANAATILINSNFEHGMKGHFSNDFDKVTTKDDLEVRKIPAGTYEQGEVDKDQYYVTRKDLNKENIESGVFEKFDTNEEALAYIESFETRRVSQPGMIAHYRRMIDTNDNIFYVTEMQSDVFQKNFEKNVYRSNEDLMKLELAEQENTQTKSDVEFYIGRYKRDIESVKSAIKLIEENPGEVGTDLAKQIEAESVDIGYYIRGREGTAKENLEEALIYLQKNIEEQQSRLDTIEKKKKEIEEKYKNLPEGAAYAKRKTGNAREAQSIVSQSDSFKSFKDYVNKIAKKYSNNLEIRIKLETLYDSEPYISIELEMGAGMDFQKVIDELNERFEIKKADFFRFIELKDHADDSLISPIYEEFKKQLDTLSQPDKRGVSLSKQFLSFKNTYTDLIVKTAIREAATNGSEMIRFPTPMTVSYIEGYQSEDDFDSGIYTEEEINDIGIGGEVEFLGHQAFITDIGPYDFEVVYAQGGLSIMYPKDVDLFKSEEIEYYSEEFEHIVSEVEFTEKLKNKIGESDFNAEESNELLKLVDTINTVSWVEDLLADKRIGTLAQEVKDDMVAEFENNFDAYERMQESYGSDSVYETNEGIIYYSSEGEGITSESVSYKTITAKEDFNLDSLSEDQRNIAAKYGVDNSGREGAYLKAIKKLKPDVKEITDPNGFTWYEAEVTPNDRASVELFQKLDQVTQSLQIAQSNIDEILSRIVAQKETVDKVKMMLNKLPVGSEMTQEMEEKVLKYAQALEKIKELRLQGIYVEGAMSNVFISKTELAEAVKSLTDKVNTTASELVKDGIVEKQEIRESEVGKRSVAVRLRQQAIDLGTQIEDQYFVKNFINEVAKSELLIENNKKMVVDIIDGKIPYPETVSKTAFIYAALEKYKIANDIPMVTKAYNALAEIGTSSGQDIALINSVYKTYDETSPEMYLNKIKAEREAIEFQSTWKLKNPLKIEEEKKKMRREKTVRQNQIRQGVEQIQKIKIEKLESILDSFMC